MRRRAFTLVEVLIAIALIIALVGSMFAFLRDTLATRERIDAHAARRRSATTLFDRLERDLVTVLGHDPKLGAGVRGDDRSLQLLVRSVPARLADSVPERALGAIETVEYRFSRAGRSLALRRAAPDAGEPSRLYTLDGDVQYARFRYYDGAQWTDAFTSSAQQGLPLAVEVAVWYDWAPPPDEDETDEVEPEAEPGRGGGGFIAFPEIGRRPALEDAAPAPRADEEFPPLPDRVRVIVLPDAAPAESSADTGGAS